MDTTEDPRSTRSREAAVAAARALLLEEGPAAVTHQRVAQRSGIGRATVYRHWPSPELLLRAVMVEADLPFFVHPADELAPWLGRELRLIGDQMAMPPVARFTTALLQGAQWDALTRQHRDELVGALTQRLATALDRAVSEGTVDAEVDAEDVAALVLGPLLYRTLLQGGPVSEALIERVVAAAVPWTPAARPSST